MLVVCPLQSIIIDYLIAEAVGKIRLTLGTTFVTSTFWLIGF